MSVKFDILDYLGLHENGVISVVSLCYDDVYYDCVFYYGDENHPVALTVDPKLEKKLGYTIEEWDGYAQLVHDLMRRVVPYGQMVNQLNEFDPGEYNIYRSDES